MKRLQGVALMLFMALLIGNDPILKHLTFSLLPGFPDRLSRAVAPILVVIGSFAAAAVLLAGIRGWGASCGSWLTSRRSGDRDPTGRTAIGLILVSLAALGLGMAGLLRPVVSWGLLVGVVAAAGHGIRGLARPEPGPAGWRSWWPCLVALLPAVPALVAAPLVPPTDVDIMGYHLGLPVLWAQAGRMTGRPGLCTTFFPLGMEYVCGVLESAGVIRLLPALTLGLLVAAAATLGSALRRVAGPTAYLPGVLLMLAMGTVLELGWKGHPDTALLLATSVGVAGLARRSTVLLAVGGALACLDKYTGGPLLVALLVSAGVAGFNRRRLVLVAAGSMMPALVWGVRNWLGTGNPVYPFLHHLFPSLGWHDWNDRGFHLALPPEFASLAGRPGELAMTWWNGRGTIDFPAWAGLLYLLPVLALSSRASRFVRAVAVQAAVFAVWWLLPVPKFGRYLLPALIPAVAALAATPWAAGVLFRRLTLAALLGAGTATFLVQSAERDQDPVAMLWGERSEGAAARRALGGYVDAIGWMNGHLTGAGRVLVIGEPSAFGFRRPWLAGDIPTDPAWRMALQGAPTLPRVRARLRQSRIRWVLYNPVRATYRRDTLPAPVPGADEIGAWAEYWRLHATVLRPADAYDWRGAWWVYELKLDPVPTADRRPHPWLPGAEAWQPDVGLLLRGEPEPRLQREAAVLGDFGVTAYHRAAAAYGAGKFRDADHWIDVARHRDLVLPWLTNLRAVIRIGRKDYAGARQALAESLALAPDNTEALGLLRLVNQAAPAR